MSSEKRVRVEEYHDPDYSQFQPPKAPPVEPPKPTNPTTDTSPKPQLPADRRATLIQFLNREFQHALQCKEQELDDINQRLGEAKKLLAKVRYAVVSHYYGKKSLQCSAEDKQAVIQNDQESMTPMPNTSETLQLPIHPSLKKLLGKRPIDYNEILKSRPTRQAAKNATEQFQKLTKKPNQLMAKAKQNDDTVDTECTDTDDTSECSVQVCCFVFFFWGGT